VVSSTTWPAKAGKLTEANATPFAPPVANFTGFTD